MTSVFTKDHIGTDLQAITTRYADLYIISKTHINTAGVCQLKCEREHPDKNCQDLI